VVITGIEPDGAGWETMYEELNLSQADTNLVVLHGQDSTQPGEELVCVPKLRNKHITYLALGHLHSYRKQPLDETGEFCYCGCLEGRGFDECGKKGFLKVRLSKVACDTEFIPLNCRRYEILDVELEEQADPSEQILEALPTDSSEHIFRIVLHGHCPKPDTEQLRKVLSEHCYAVELLDKTEGSGDLWEGITEDTLRGEVLKELKSRLDAAGEEEQEQILRAAKLIRDLMDGREISV
jgi:DNA repair exonuclease SbcCD nuclease subunit